MRFIYTNFVYWKFNFSFAELLWRAFALMVHSPINKLQVFGQNLVLTLVVILQSILPYWLRRLQSAFLVWSIIMVRIFPWMKWRSTFRAKIYIALRSFVKMVVVSLPVVIGVTRLPRPLMCFRCYGNIGFIRLYLSAWTSNWLITFRIG